MASILPQNIADAVIAYRRTVLNEPGKVWDLSADYRNHYFGQLEKSRLKYKTKNSKSFHAHYMLSGYSNVQLDSFFNPDSISRSDLGEEATVYWSYQKTHAAFDRREPGWGSGSAPEQIFDYLELQFKNMFQKYYDANERYLWTLPAAPNDGSSAQVAPWGIPYYITQSATAAVGTNGGHPSGYTSVAGLSRTTNPQLKNYTAVASSMSQGDFVKKASEMIDMMQWKPPKPMAIEQSANYRFEMVSGYAPYAEYQQLATASNDNLGSDMGKYYGNVPYGTQVFRGIVWSWSDALTSATLPDGTANAAYDSNLPVYLLDWSTWDLFAAQDFYMRMDEPITLDNPHNVVVQWMDSAYQLFCHNPRCNGVIRTA